MRQLKPGRVAVSAAAELLGNFRNVEPQFARAQAEHAAVRRVPVACGEGLSLRELVPGVG